MGAAYSPLPFFIEPMKYQPLNNVITLQLSKREIDRVFRERDARDWDKLIGVYDFLRLNLLRAADPAIWPTYQTRFNYFYQVRRNEAWRKKFYEIFFKYAGGPKIDFRAVVNEIFAATGQVEMSFASKMASTIDPELPVIDRHVLSFLDRRPPPVSRPPEERLKGIVALHDAMHDSFHAFLETDAGRYLIERFQNEHEAPNVGPMKMLDFVLWQSGGKRAVR